MIIDRDWPGPFNNQKKKHHKWKQKTGLKSSDVIESFVEEYRKEVNFIKEDEIMFTLMQKSVDFLENIEIVEE